MKKTRISFILFKILLVLTVGLSLWGCESKTSDSSVELQSGVSFSLLDALKIDNKTTNTIYYYFLAGITNESQSVYHMSNLEYNITEEGDIRISPIDRYRSTISEDLQPGTSTFVYGYIGYPDNNEHNVGLEFPKSKEFLSFQSVKVRQIIDENVNHSQDAIFTVYEDEYFAFEVNSSQVEYSYQDGVSRVDGLEISYKNKTDSRLVVPYLTPVCTLQGISLSDYENEKELQKMPLEEIQKQDFDTNGLAPRTTSFTGKALGYQLYYLTPEQEYTCTISFEFENAVPDFKNDSGKAISISIQSASLGYSQVIPVSYPTLPKEDTVSAQTDEE